MQWIKENEANEFYRSLNSSSNPSLSAKEFDSFAKLKSNISVHEIEKIESEFNALFDSISKTPIMSEDNLDYSLSSRGSKK